MEADAAAVERIAARYMDPYEAGQALNDYFHNGEPPAEYDQLRRDIGSLAKTMRAAALRELEEKGDEEQAEGFAEVCADEIVKGIRQKILAECIEALKCQEGKRAGDEEAARLLKERILELVKTYASDCAVRTEAQSTLQAGKETGMQAVWDTTTGECVFCQKLDGHPVDMGDGRGIHMLPPAHKGCTCTVRLVKRDNAVKGPEADGNDMTKVPEGCIIRLREQPSIQKDIVQPDGIPPYDTSKHAHNADGSIRVTEYADGSRVAGHGESMSVVQYVSNVSEKAGTAQINRAYYDENGDLSLQINFGTHNRKNETYDVHGVHAHDYESGKRVDYLLPEEKKMSDGRNLTEKEKIEHGEILKLI